MPKDISPDLGLRVAIGQYSDAGRKPANQDFHGAVLPEGAALRLKGIALAIADGISSSPVSREAAETAVKSLLTDYYCTSDAWTAKTAASRVIAATNSWLHAQNRRARLDSMDRGQVCTLSALILKHRTAHLFHVGDARIWRLASATLEPLTEDHRVIVSPDESYLGRALGAEPQVEIDYRCLDLNAGDIFLLTTDGVHEHMDPRAAARLLSRAADLDCAAETLAREAYDHGSEDNLTVQVLRVESLPVGDMAMPVDEVVHLPIPPLPDAGTVIDGFHVLRRIHASARSHVFLAEAPDGARVALKIPAVDLRDNEALLRRFPMEEWVARRVASPHIVAAGASPETRTGLYVVTDYVEGRTLRQWMTDRPKPDLDQVRDILGQIVQGLRALHRREMLHQDLRPENVMIDRAGTVKIIDLASARVAGVAEAGPPDEEILGTLQYTAPEYFTGDPVSWRSDLFSLGVIAYEMLTGRLPYGTAVSQVRSRRDASRLLYRPARDETSPVPDWMDEALRRAVHPDPLRRQEALSEFVAELRSPGAGWRAKQHVPLMERDPVRFWQVVSLLLAVLVVLLLARLAA
jgi:serine/threonine protein phosphatase PrpC